MGISPTSAVGCPMRAESEGLMMRRRRFRGIVGLGGLFAVAVSVGGMASGARANMVVNTTDTTIATGSWGANPSYLSVPNNNFSAIVTAQANPSAQAGAVNTVLSETFTPGSSGTFGAPNASGFTLGAIQLLAQGGS